ncbi:MAG: 2-succinyl-5-enolpyruvyl-6-hydroxy-3-cyclohexene-1-carboxylic-acid synthase [Chloroflexi bacterium]|nr:2-succinyl-5-enolpyruvyl-6-hydroxy-3-cyclohexene-1-carboxylic-acid synthase [Chloroflexota bacterium]
MSKQIHNSQFTIHNSQLSNPNLLWATLFVNALAHSGLTAVIISPGSRSTPLTLAFDAHPQIETFLHLDERGAGFFALGMAIASDKPVALVCTSGTAVANYLPAIIEAHMSQVPLLILTGDRPHELRHSGANQTIDQVKIFGDQVLWSVDMALPEANTADVILRNVGATAVRAYATANGLSKGPVHVNFPFRKPLEPDASGEWQVASQELFTIHNSQSTIHNFAHGKITPTAEQLDWLTAVIQQRPQGLIICGPRCPGGNFPAAVRALAQQTGYPILADAISGVRFSRAEFTAKNTKSAKKKSAKSVKSADNLIISGYETFLQGDPGWPEPEIIIRFGAVPISKWLNAYLDKINPAIRIHIRENGVWADDSHRTSHFLQLNETAVCQQLVQKLAKRKNNEWITTVTQTDNSCWTHLQTALADKYFDGATVADIVELIPEGATLFMGNSSPIRHLDQYGRSQSKQITTHANRGASGIDGNLATALGMYAANSQPLVAVVGDITFFHDMNSLHLIKSELQRHKDREGNKNITIVLLHNNGGSIFNRLPIAQIEPPFTKLFLTPHDLDFEPACRMFGLDYIRADSREAFRTAFAASVQGNQPRVIAVHTNNQQDDVMRQEINQQVIESLNNH